MREKTVLGFKYVKYCHLRKKFALWDPRRPMNGTDRKVQSKEGLFSRKSCLKVPTSCIVLRYFEEVGEPWGWEGQYFCRMNFFVLDALWHLPTACPRLLLVFPLTGGNLFTSLLHYHSLHTHLFWVLNYGLGTVLNTWFQLFVAAYKTTPELSDLTQLVSFLTWSHKSELVELVLFPVVSTEELAWLAVSAGPQMGSPAGMLAWGLRMLLHVSLSTWLLGLSQAWLGSPRRTS